MRLLPLALRNVPQMYPRAGRQLKESKTRKRGMKRRGQMLALALIAALTMCMGTVSAYVNFHTKWGNPAHDEAATLSYARSEGTTVTVNAPDTTPPTVQSIVSASPNPTTSGSSVQFTVTFSEAVTGVDATDFQLITMKLSGASITGVSGSGAIYTVTVSTGTTTSSAYGSLQMLLIDDDTITDAAGNKLGGTGTRNADFPGEGYTVNAPDDFSSFVVNTTLDTDDTCTALGTGNGCSLREAITAANRDVGVETITFSIPASDTGCTGGACTITLGSALPDLSTSMQINGPGASQLTISGNNRVRVFSVTVASPGAVSFSGLTISNGIATGSTGGGIAINSSATVNVTNSTLSQNFASNGGAIYNGSTGTLNVTNSTLSNNPADVGGAIYNGTGAVNVANCTISQNHANFDGGGIYNYTGPAKLRNSIVALNTASNGPDLFGPFISQGHNLIGKNDAAQAGFPDGNPNVNQDIVGTSAVPIDPLLGPLVNNGGPTPTHALLAGSPALDRGSDDLIPQDTTDLDGDGDTTEPLPFDQRGPGYPRRADAADAGTIQTVDIGAFEALPSIEDITDKTTSEDTPLYFNFNFGDRSLGIKDVAATSNNTALMANGGVDCFPTGSTCSYFRAPNSNQFGSAVITIIITANNGAVMRDSFKVTVDPVNDPPSFTKGPDQSVNQDTGAWTIPGWATNISAGPSNESGQALTFITTNDNNSLFAVQPRISSDGTLSYRSAGGAYGIAHVTVVLKDDGGGADTSAPQTFTINVNEVNDAPVNTVPGAQTTDENTALTFSAAHGNPISISDVDAGSSAVQVTLTATNGTLTLSGMTGLSFTTGDGTADATMTFSGTIASINAALNGLIFTPTAGFHGAASLQITTNDQGNTGSGGALSDTDTVPVTVNERSLQFSSANFTVGEADGHATITVTRLHGTTDSASVQYSTSDLSGLTNCNVNTGDASARCDYTAVGGTLNFAPGQSSASFTIPIVNDVYVEGPETLTLTLSNPVGGILGTPSTATLTITDNDASPGAPNPIDQRDFLIRQHYMDFLNREPEPQGLQDWLAILNNCPAGDKSCDSIGVSSGFFRSPEFFDRAYFVYRFYETALGRKPTHDEYQNDLRQVAGFLTSAELEARKAAFAEGFSQRPEVKARYDSKANGDEYVDAIVATAGVIPSIRASVAGRQGSLTITRGQALRELLESAEISQHFFNEAFVVVGYFAYLKRDPDALYLVWIDKLNNPQAGQSYEDTYREMIRGFIGSQEYRARFGP